MNFKEIYFDSYLYEQALELREEILRQPLGLSLSDEDLSQEPSHTHFGACAADILVACLMVVPFKEEAAAGKKCVQIRQMVVSEDCQGRGIGSFLLRKVESELGSLGVEEIHISARRTAEKFYRHMGYEIYGEEFESVTIPHIMMKKLLVA